ncbi:MAG: nucleotidyltransferase [Candidatus Omnitrophica bacterium]|nr:nucleotidyltransferase [Candidatus Omnitrophota bacterium]
MRVEKDFEELLRLLNKHKAKYCIVGAFAIGFYGYPRYTKDIDIFVEPSLKNGERIVEALNEFGFSCLNLKPEDFSKKGAIIQLGYEPIRVDLITSIKGCNFNQAWQHKARGQYGGQKVYFIGLEELIKNKRMVNRYQDRSDLKLLLEVLGKSRVLLRTKGHKSKKKR